MQASIEKESVRLAKRLRTEDYVVDVAEIDRRRAYWRGQLDLVNQPEAAVKKLNREQERTHV